MRLCSSSALVACFTAAIVCPSPARHSFLPKSIGSKGVGVLGGWISRMAVTDNRSCQVFGGKVIFQNLNLEVKG
ncbi:hypothetical protein O6P43_002441 [Quillaja saponaria]|uniref:Secreted protein n=1 Tax=Quillaja saponaria TaxID=32244 RepID=A0AAD7QCR4_QUISA|nr:hypothetical protein O6P43_002441 [Quillaja saponaria]